MAPYGKNEGEYDFSFFDKVIEKAKAKGLKVIFGTPTATMPAWLAKNIPKPFRSFRMAQREPSAAVTSIASAAAFTEATVKNSNRTCPSL